MTLIEKIKADSLSARKNREELKSALLVTLHSEAAMVGKNDGNRETTDAETVAVTKKFIKNAEETINALDVSDPRAMMARLEIGFLGAYLPKQLTVEELSVIVESIITNLGCERSKKSTGAVMAELKRLHAGTYDGGVASKLLQTLFA